MLTIAARHNRGHAHVEICAGLSLRVHARITVYKARDDELAGAVNNPRNFGDNDRSCGPNFRYLAISNDDDNVLNIASRVPPVRYVDQRAAGENKRNRTRGIGSYLLCRLG